VNAWGLAYDGFEPPGERLREALCTLGNGYFATRGAAPEATADAVHYPGTYVAGVYNRLVSLVAGREVENEDLVNVPNWLPLTFRPEGGGWLNLQAQEVLGYRQELDLRRGVLTRQARVRYPDGRVIAVTQRRFVSMDDPHLAGLETTVVPENWSGTLEIRSALDGQVTNAGVERYRALDGRHLLPIETGQAGDDTVWLLVETRTSRVRIAQAARTRAVRDGQPLSVERRTVQEPGLIAQHLVLDVREREPVTIEKVVALFTSKDQAIAEPGDAARGRVARLPDGFDRLLERHTLAWDQL
jgi:trehalose/maltose hydrolase-like predicted phosphorylase